MPIIICLALIAGIFVYPVDTGLSQIGLVGWMFGAFVSVMVIIVGFKKSGATILCFILGLFWMHLACQHYRAWQVPNEWEGKPILLTGTIDRLPVKNSRSTLISVVLQECSGEHKSISCQGARVHLGWQNAPPLHVGESWQLMAKLKRIHGLKNIAGVDHERLALQQSIQATGGVVGSFTPQKRLNTSPYFIVERFRQDLTERLRAALPRQSSVAHWLLALMTGVRDGIPREQWEVLRKTGTNHLMAIAGLHIGIIAGLAYVIANWLWRLQTRWLTVIPAQHAAQLVAFVVAGFYSTLAGWSLPTERAFLMLFVMTLATYLQINISRWLMLLYVMLIVLAMDPLSILSDSFWLSFGTIALIIYGMSGRVAPSGLWWHRGRVQWVIGLGLIPFSLVFFQEASLISFVANSITIPIISLLILPVTFLSSLAIFVSPTLTNLMLVFADWSMNFLWTILLFFAGLPGATWSQAITSVWAFCGLLCALVLLLLPKGCHGKWCGIVWALPVFISHPAQLQSGEIRLSVLDVGQGLAVLIQTQSHTLLYDAGPRLTPENDMGERVVLPVLRAAGVNQLDKMVISHGDNDHIGGAEAILDALRVRQVETSVPEKLRHLSTRYCFSGQSWVWDGVTFTYLYPLPARMGLGNDSSCVLKIDNGMQSILLPGDIEQGAEKWLLEHVPKQLKSTVLIAPHHGSLTSIETGFIEAVRPKVVIYATGYRNRYHLPHPTVVEAYRKQGATGFDTANNGAVSLLLSK